MKQFKCVRWTVCVVINRLLTDIYFYIVFGVLEMQMNCYFNIFKFCDLPIPGCPVGFLCLCYVFCFVYRRAVYCVQCLQATNTNFIVFGLTQLGVNPTIYRTRGERPTIYRTRGERPTIYRT